jgi:hypothetical protein
VSFIEENSYNVRMANKVTWLTCTVGVAFAIIPFALDGLGMELNFYVYAAFLLIGAMCLLYAMHGIGGLAYEWIKESIKFQWPIVIKATKASEGVRPESIPSCPLKLIFNEISNVSWETQCHPILKNDEIRIKNYCILIKNISQSDVKNLEIEIEKAVFLKDRTTDPGLLPVVFHKKLCFESDGTTRLDTLSPGATAKLPFLAYSNAMLLNDPIKVKVKNDDVVYHMNHRWRFSTIITCSGMSKPLNTSFLAWVDHNTGSLLVEVELGD